MRTQGCPGHPRCWWRGFDENTSSLESIQPGQQTPSARASSSFNDFCLHNEEKTDLECWDDDGVRLKDAAALASLSIFAETRGALERRKTIEQKSLGIVLKKTEERRSGGP
ncbi:unnamed protein product [Heligmosomoides polygyrus]|uniref:Uncharacterized protein n=1 Tax=Heligmosomoides polygyrus TaxID=6339 RepID=A0A183F755_HELPZ|nr:unnamed protein product [Heligmosomoides polygyrus]